ncbi:TonB-dependent receptor plug domain-containing protein [Tenacibaculum finnmarkense genomovar ulcerans]|uniref:TonB-dependent receptor n=2 Tax=Tenacibaculum finnmarkense TaxID=2781243 RepID=UPI00187B7B08|nr:TonB-dependent receptor [Tenacibaculum finnmarkense]MBE7634248.1 TonB-dependent receptor plug domain-containing protein [Tenacibaculum finnmarkense genomovar ulcerans]MBE7645987.1 TonB-dependent receptor plug domain-containing protein [Tenacibaculum finnmarkense genomovar ulcerans]MCG8733871.1 TonB-dependent receptor [Tenacibaculum finnmarkense]MCG8755116.1 TonB-dependent receptor [Tenacibaculum finnmarkense]MCG8830766.1 TonB-dependent receptor [Tenacibaculum finnmarkense]
MKNKQFITLLGVKNVSQKHAFLMKATLSICLFFCLQIAATSTFSQNKVTLSYKNTTLEIILNQIEKQTDYSFVFNNDEVNIQQKFTINVVNKELDKAIKLLFRNTAIKYQVKNTLIILSKENKNSTILKTAEQKYSISGTVKDATTGETLLGANIVIKDALKGTTTNEYGFYSMTILKGIYVLQISYVGYKSKEIKVDLSNNIKRNFELTLAENALEEVVVKSTNTSKSQVRTILTGVSSLRAAEVKKLPAFFGEPDITRAVLTQPGVSTVGEGASGFNVRGGNIDQNLLLLDEAPLYNSSHLWGLFSAINTDALKDLKFYKGGIPARFGGRASSVLDMRQKEGSSKIFKAEGGVGLLFSRVTLEGPIKKDKLSFLVSGRRTYFDLFFPLAGEDLKNQKMYFYDLNTKLSWNINDNNTLFLSGYFGKDVMKFKAEEETEYDEQTQTETTEPAGEISFSWNNATTSLRWNHVFSNKLFMNLSTIYSSYKYALAAQNDGPSQTDSGSAFEWTSSVENYIFKPDFTYYLNPETKMRFGIHGTYYRFTPAKITSTEQTIGSIDLSVEKGLEIAPYYELEKKWDKLSMNVGTRYAIFRNLGPYEVASYASGLPKTPSTITGQVKYKSGKTIAKYGGFEPRLSLKYDIDDRKSLKIGYNKMYQYIHLMSNSSAALPFDVWKLSGKYVKPLAVNQYSFGFAFDSENRNYNFSVEGYYKDFKNLVEYVNNADLFINKNIETQLLPANGYAYGSEFSVHKTKGKLTGNLNYTYSVSKRKTVSEFSSENINNGAYFSSNYDKPHIFNATANYKFSDTWTMGTFFTFQSGRPTTIITGRGIYGKNKDETVFTYSDRNKYRMKNTHRLDVSLTYSSEASLHSKWKGSWSFGFYNIYGRKNAFSNYYTFSNNENEHAGIPKTLNKKQFSLFGAPIPFITYNFKF